MLARKIVTMLITALLYCCPVDSFLFTSKAVIKPTDALVFIGETLKVECKLQSWNTSYSDMYFEITPRDNDSWKIPQEKTIIGSKSITAELEITDRYSNYTTVFCMDKNDQKPQMLRSAAIYVEYPITNITDLKATFYYDNTTLILTWSLGQTYLNPSSIKVDVDWSPFAAPELKGNACNLSNREFCAITEQSQALIFIRFKISHDHSSNRQPDAILVPLYGTSATEVFEFHLYDYLKTGPPDALKVENVTETCVTVSWVDSLYFHSNIYTKATHRIEIKVDGEPEFRVVVDNDTRLNSSDLVSVCQLTPFTKYSLSVQLRDKSINPWSDRSVVAFKTEEDRPLTGPPITDTSYQVGECMSNKRDVFVYWKDPSKASLRGNLIRFEVVSNNITKLLRPAYNYYSDSIDCDSTSVIRVYSATSAGTSLVPSEMSVPKQSDELTLEKDLMFRLEEKSVLSDGRSTINMTVMWDPGELVKDVKIIVYMCAETYVPNTCFNDFKTVEANIGEKEIQLIDIPSTTNLFGYALKDNNGHKQGIRWTSCVYRTDTKLDKPAGLHVVPGSQANSLEISWTSSWCIKSTKVLVLRYYLLICKQPLDKCVDMACCLNITISDFSINNYTARNLKGGHLYYVYIQAESFAGLGFPSDAKEGIPSISVDSSTKVGTIIGITMGTVLGVIFIGSMIFCFVRHCRKSVKRIEMLQKETKFVLNCQQIDSQQIISHQSSDDSGNCTGSYQNSSNESKPVPPQNHPPNVHCVAPSTCATSSTISSVLEETPVEEDAGAGVFSMGVDDSDSSPSNMQHGNANLELDISHAVGARPLQPCTRVDAVQPCSRVDAVQPCTNMDSIQPCISLDAVQLHTNSESNMESRVVRRKADISVQGDCASVNGDMKTLNVVNTNNSIPYMLVMNENLLHAQPAQDSNIDQDVVPNEISSDSCPVLQLDGTSHLPHLMQQNVPRQDIISVCTHQVNGQIAPEGEGSNQSQDYVRSTDGNIDYQIEYCRPDTGSVVPHNKFIPLKCPPLLKGRIHDQNIFYPRAEDSNVRSNRTDSLASQEMSHLSEYQISNSNQEQNETRVSAQEDCISNSRTDWIDPRQSVLSSDFQSVPDHSKEGENATGSNIPENHVNYCYKIDDHPSEIDSYIRQCDDNSDDIEDDDDIHGVRVSHTCLDKKAYSDEFTSLLLGSNLSFHSSTCSLVQNDFNIDDLISNGFMNDRGSVLNMQSEVNPHITTGEHLEVLNGLNQDTEFRNGELDGVDVREDPEVIDCDHQEASTDYNPRPLLQGNQSDSFEDEDSEEASRDVEFNDSSQLTSSAAGNSGYVPLSCQNMCSSSDGSDVNQVYSCSC